VPRLTSIGDDFYVRNNDILRSLSAPRLQTVVGTVNISLHCAQCDGISCATYVACSPPPSPPPSPPSIWQGGGTCN